jgi:hypothetical protein
MLRNTALALALVLTACRSSSGDDEDPDDDSGTATDTETETDYYNGTHPTFAAICAGAHEGTHIGELTGTIRGELADNGAIALGFYSGSPMSVEAWVMPDGMFGNSSGQVGITGDYNLGTCTGSGEWTAAEPPNETGTFVIGRSGF